MELGLLALELGLFLLELRPNALQLGSLRLGLLSLLLRRGLLDVMLPAVRSSSAYSTCAAMSAVLTASFPAVSSTTFYLSSDQRNQDKLR